MYYECMTTFRLTVCIPLYTKLYTVPNPIPTVCYCEVCTGVQLYCTVLVLTRQWGLLFPVFLGTEARSPCPLPKTSIN